MKLKLPQAYGRAPKPEEQQSQRLTDALFNQRKEEESQKERIELDARLTFSSREVLQRMDFDSMSAAELAQAKQMIARLRLPLPTVRTRRLVRQRSGARVDLRATLRESLR